MSKCLLRWNELAEVPVAAICHRDPWKIWEVAICFSPNACSVFQQPALCNYCAVAATAPRCNSCLARCSMMPNGHRWSQLARNDLADRGSELWLPMAAEVRVGWAAGAESAIAGARHCLSPTSLGNSSIFPPTCKDLALASIWMWNPQNWTVPSCYFLYHCSYFLECEELEPTLA